MSDRTSERCRHRKCWIIMGGRMLWCYECGAWRQLDVVGATTSAPASAWCEPAGPGGGNPHEEFAVRDLRWQKRYGRVREGHRPVLAAMDPFAVLALAEAGDDE